VDESVLNQRLGDIEKLGLPKPKSYVDIRKLLEDKDTDAISIATPNHWHALMAIWACQAGKDVYVEKPCSHNWFEGRQLVRAVKKYSRILPARQPVAIEPGNAGSHSATARRHHRRRVHGPRPLLQVAAIHRARCGGSRSARR